jgi:hypothetical protein
MTTKNVVEIVYRYAARHAAARARPERHGREMNRAMIARGRRGALRWIKYAHPLRRTLSASSGDQQGG